MHTLPHPPHHGAGGAGGAGGCGGCGDCVARETLWAPLTAGKAEHPAHTPSKSNSLIT